MFDQMNNCATGIIFVTFQNVNLRIPFFQVVKTSLEKGKAAGYEAEAKVNTFRSSVGSLFFACEKVHQSFIKKNKQN